MECITLQYPQMMSRNKLNKITRLTHFSLLLWGYMKKKRITIAILAIFTLFLTLGWIFWSLGSIKQIEKSVLRLVILQGTVYVKTDNGFEEQAKNGMILRQGDIVRTGENSEATITAFGKSDLRLSENTQVAINEAVIGTDREFTFKFDLYTGRVWSRVMKLLDFNNIYESRSDNVVATVRGTSYGLEKNNANILLYVDKAAVAVEERDKSGSEIYTSKQWILYDIDKALINTGNEYSTTTPIDHEWVENQRMADVKFNEASKKYLLDSLKGENGVAPDNWKSSLANLSESWHLRFSGEKCADLKSAYFGRKLYYVYDLVSRGKSGLAYQYLSELQKQAHEDFLNNECTDKLSYANKSGIMLLALSDVTPESELYKLKMLIEEMHTSFFDEHSPESFWARALALDSRLDELERFDCKNNLQGSMQQSLDVVTQGILRQDRDFEMLSKNLNLSTKKILEQKTFAQNKRLNDFLNNLEICKQPLEQKKDIDVSATSTTSTEMDLATSTEDIFRYGGGTLNQDVDNKNTIVENQQNNTIAENQQNNTTSERDQTNNLNLARIQLFAQPNPVFKGESSILYVKGIKRNGDEFDATRYAKFEQTEGLGSILGITFTAKKAGSVNITAKVVDDGQEYISQIALNIIEPLILSYISASAVSGNTLSPGSAKNISAIAYYSNGQSRDVTNFASYSVSDRRMGNMNGSVFTASANAYGQVVITVSYEEEGITKESQVTLQIDANRIN